MTATTPNEAYEAWKARTQLIKISPAHPMGGAEYIEDILLMTMLGGCMLQRNLFLYKFSLILKLLFL